jgi:hypothetical protein
MLKSLKFIMVVMISAIIFYACENENIVPEPTPVPTGTISFNKDIVPIFTAKCIACHGNNGQAPNLATNPYQSLSSGGYFNTSAPVSSKLYIKLNASNSTHAGRSSAAEQAKILYWIEKGAENN